MIGFLMGWWRAREARPLLWWVAGLLVYVTLPVPQQWVLALIVGLGVALTVTLARLREGGHRLQHSERAWELTHRLGNAVEDRIPGAHNQQGQVLHTAPEGSVLHAPPAHGAGAVYDPGALLSAVVAVLAAEAWPPTQALRYRNARNYWHGRTSGLSPAHPRLPPTGSPRHCGLARPAGTGRCLLGCWPP